MNINQRITMLRNTILSECAQCVEYADNWGTEYVTKVMHDSFNNKQGFAKVSIVDPLFSIADFQSLSREELYAHGFVNWDDSLVLIPLWIKNYILPDQQVIGISGRTTKLSDADTDVRAGCIAFGFHMENTK